MRKNICVVGAGYWGKNHIRTLNDLGALSGVVEKNKNIIKQMVKEYPHINTYQSVDEALANDRYMGFIVSTPAETHHNIAVKIIKSGKHVLVEKPLCLNVEDAKNLVDLSKQYQVSLMVGHVLLFHPAIQKIKKMLVDGNIGELQYIYSNRVNLGQVRTEENVFWSLAPHDISIFQYLTDSYPKSIIAKGSAFLQKGIHDSTITYLKYPNGVDGHIFVSWLQPFKEHRLVVIGSKAMISFEDSKTGKPLKLYSKKFDFNLGVPEKIDGPVTLIDYEEKMTLTEELQYFLNNLDGGNPEIANGNHALEVIRLLTEASKQVEKE